jgi:hypothetical protein
MVGFFVADRQNVDMKMRMILGRVPFANARVQNGNARVLDGKAGLALGLLAGILMSASVAQAAESVYRQASEFVAEAFDGAPPAAQASSSRIGPSRRSRCWCSGRAAAGR